MTRDVAAISRSSTWDGTPVSPDPPFGASIVVRQGDDYLVLRRRGAIDGGDWEWTPPSGARLPGEAIEACAVRELVEETGLRGISLTLVSDAGTRQVFLAHVPAGTVIRLDREHVEFRWVPLGEAIRLCKPQIVADGLVMAGRI